jgi:transposase
MVSELLDRIRGEIRERLEATRAAVLEHERLEAALQALGDAGSRGTRAVRGGGHGSREGEAARRSRAAAKTSSPRARTGERRSKASGTAKGAARARAGAAPARKRAPRGANREAVLRVIGQRPGVTTRELAAASQVTGGTLYTLLRRLTDEGTLEKRQLAGGQTGYALATSTGAAGPAAGQPQTATTEASPGAESRAAEGPERDRADSTQTADAARSAPTEATSDQAPDQPADADETPTPQGDR